MNIMNETVLITAFTPTVDKLDNLRELVKKIKSYGYKVCLSTHSPTSQDIIDRCDYFLYDKENELNNDIDIRHWRFYNTPNFSITYKPNDVMATHIVPIARLIIGGLSYLKTLGAKKVYLLEYDTIMETDEVFKTLSSSLDESTVTGFFDGWGEVDDNLEKYRKGKYLFGPLMGLNVDRVDLSLFPTDSETLVSLFRKSFHEAKNPVTERIFFDLLWSKYDIKWNEFEIVKNGLSVNTSAYEPMEYSDRTYCFFLRDGNVNFFAENNSGTDWKVDLIVNELCHSISVGNNQWAFHGLPNLEQIKTIKVIINNKFMEELNMGLEKDIERITKWCIFEEKNSVENIDISFDMVPIVEIKNSNGKNKIVRFVGVDENEIESLVYECEISDGKWAKPNNVYFKNWKVYIDNDLRFQTDLTLNSTCVIIASYPNSDDVKNKTVDTIRNIKQNIGLPVMCSTHIHYEPNPDELIQETDHYIMNPINTLTKQSHYRYYRGQHDNYNVFIDLWESENSYYHGPAVHQCYWNAVNFAKELGYQYAVLTNFDMLFSKNDLEKIKCILNTVMVNNKDGFFFYSMNEEGPTYATVFCVVNVDMFLKKFPNEIISEEDYNNLMKDVGSESNGLENIYFHVLKNENLFVREERENHFFESDKCLTNSQADYLAILPIRKDSNLDLTTDTYGIFIRRANKDIIETKLSLTVNIYGSGEVILNEDFVINSDFVKVIPLVFDKSNQYEINLIDEENSRVIKRTKRNIIDFDSLNKNGEIIEF